MRSERAIIVLKPRFLGDTVMATPLIDRVKREYEATTLWGSPLVRELLREDLDRLQVDNSVSLKRVGALVQEARRLRGERYQVAFIVNRSFRSALLTVLARIPTRVGHRTEGRGPLLTHRVPHDPLRHEGEAYGDLARAVGLEGAYDRVFLTVSEAERQRGLEIAQGATVALHPGASMLEKRMPLPALKKMVEALADQGHRIALFGGKEERSYGEELANFTSVPLLNLIGTTDLRETLGALSHFKLMIAGSTGVMHMAVAMGVPTVGVFGPNLASRWGHSYGRNQAIQIPSKRIADLDPDVVLAAAAKALSSGS